jgi:hypothetical protein
MNPMILLCLTVAAVLVAGVTLMVGRRGRTKSK